MNYPKVSIIILNWNGLEDTVECLESLKKITYPYYEVIVVDNGSEGNDAQVLKDRFSDYIHLIENDKNYGFAGGVNIGMRYAMNDPSPDYFLLLNNDTVVAPDFLDQLVKMTESDSTIGITGAKIYYYGFPNHIQSVGDRVHMMRGTTSMIGNRAVDSVEYDRQHEVDFFGPCILIKNKVVQKIGLFDESYFCYWEDVDYCIRAKRAGYKIVYVFKARVWHKKSTRLEPWYRALRKKKQVTEAPYATYYSTRNSFKFMKKHAAKWQYLAFLFYFLGVRLWFTAGVCLVYQRNTRRLISFFHGTLDGICAKSLGQRY
jgi:GT2 family glycosyltransferase